MTDIEGIDVKKRKYTYPFKRECVCCGASFTITSPKQNSKKHCEACDSFISRGIMIDGIFKKRKKRKSRLGFLERAARAADMTYGRYRGSILAGITPRARKHMGNISWLMWKAEIYAIVRRQQTLAERR